MIDIKLVRENPKLVKDNIKKKFQNEKLPLVDKVKKLDEEWRKLKYKGDALRSERNKISQEINQAKKQKKDAKALIKKAKEIPRRIKKIEEKTKKFQVKIREIMFKIPNIMHKSVPVGKTEKDNVEIKRIGKQTKFNFKPKNHIELGENLGLLDFDSSANVAGKGFYYLKGDLALLNTALINFARDYMIKKGFEYIEPPLMIREEILNGVYSTKEIEQMAYKIEGEDLYPIATSEHPLIGQFINKLIKKKEIPIKQTAYSMSFRKEIGSHGIEEKGLFRTHQFNKQEMIVICEPSESDQWFNKMLQYSVDIFKALKIPIRTIEMCSGDLGDLKHKQIDIEAWSPIKKEYYEEGSCANLTDAQARRLNIKIEKRGKRYFAHTLNNTVIATSRTIMAIMENNQQKDGSIEIPKPLQKYMNGKKVIGKKKN